MLLRNRHLLPALLHVILLLCLLTTPALAIDSLLALKVKEADAKLIVLEQNLASTSQRPDLEILKELQAQGLEIRRIAESCIETSEQEIKKSVEDLEILGNQAITESDEVTKKRQSLNQGMLNHAEQLANCRLILLRANEMVEESLAMQQQSLAHELLAKRNHLLINMQNNLFQPVQVLQAIIDFVQRGSGLEHLWQNRYLVLSLFILSLGMALLTRRWVKTYLERSLQEERTGYLSQFQQSLLSCLYRYTPALMITGVQSVFFAYNLFISGELNFIALLIIGLFFYTLINLLIRLLLNPCPPGERLTELPEQVSLLLSRRLKLLSKLLLVGFLMFLAIQTHDFPQQITDLLRNIYLFLLVMNLIWAVWLLRYYEGVSNIHFLRVFIVLGLMLCLLSDWMGYTNLSNYLLVGIIGSLLLWALTIFILRLWTDFLDSMDEGRAEWQINIRRRIGLQADDYLPGSIWFRFTFAVIIWSTFAVALLKVWGLPDHALLTVGDTITDGFDIGTVRVVPVKVVIALLMFAFMLSIIGWIKRRMEKSWLSRSRMDRGSKESMISLTGYFGVAMAFLIALSIAGVELANIALIAGALSVGIGFGLQNIVNNFVSGVILLFERPIKTGDWIVVGGTEGYVKKISIRSTQIQTFNRSDVIVPNSELISGQVTNLMLRDSIGRIEVPVGVAYGTDTATVKEILLNIAHNHPSVLTHSPILPKPYVLFRSFGDSSLDFELRCFIRDVDSRLSVISDMNFDIDLRFKEAGIEIPFPQRDVHLIATADAEDVSADDISRAGKKSVDDEPEPLK